MSDAPRATTAALVALAATLRAQLAVLERAGGDGALHLPGGRTLPVTHLGRVVDAASGCTKGGLMRYYLRVARAVVPVVEGRPLVLTRLPRGVGGPRFHQHDPGPRPPDALDVVTLADAEGHPERRVTGSLAALLWAVQLGAVGVHAWHARATTADHPDYAVLDLDPAPDVPFDAVVRLARRVRDALHARGRNAVPKTSGSRGIHLLVPLPADAGWADAAALAAEVAEEVAAAAPALATVARALGDRPPGTIYLDHLQNARGKTLAAALTARARPGLPVSTPLPWAALRPGLDPRRHTVATVPRRLATIERHWTAAWASARAAMP